MHLSSDNDDAAGSSEGKTEALRQLKEIIRLKASQKPLNELLSKSQEEAVVKAAGSQSQSGSITVTFGDNFSGFNARIINGGVSRISFGGE